MNLNKYIRIQLVMLSQKYDISLIEITKVMDNQLSKHYTVNIKEKSDDAINKQEHFNSKKSLVSWLMCLD